MMYVTYSSLHIEFLGIGNFLEAPDVWGRVARNPVQQECREPLLQEDRSSREQVVYGLPLLLSTALRLPQSKTYYVGGGRREFVFD